jgi:hypothetical protein
LGIEVDDDMKKFEDIVKPFSEAFGVEWLCC